MQKNPKNQIEDKNIVIKNSNVLKENENQKRVEITEEKRRQRASEVGMLFSEKENLIKTRAEREEKKKKELVEVRGVLLTTDELVKLVAIEPLPYNPLFSYSTSYFKELYRIYFPDRDYKEYPKPPLVAKLFREIIYGRFDKIILDTLCKLNPLLWGRGRKRKLFQHLKSTGQAEIEKFRDETIEVLRESPAGQSYEFRKKLHEKHGVPYQVIMDFEKKD